MVGLMNQTNYRYPEGITAISRWLSEATPPESNAPAYVRSQRDRSAPALASLRDAKHSSRRHPVVALRLPPVARAKHRQHRTPIRSRRDRRPMRCHPSGMNGTGATANRWWRCAYHRLMARTPSGLTEEPNGADRQTALLRRSETPKTSR